MDAFGVVLPLVSTLVGAGITYWLNVRVRRRNYVEDLFNEAIASVAGADASIDYLSNVGRPPHLSDDEYAELQKWLVTEGLKNWAVTVARANEALARVLPYQPDLAEVLPYRPDDAHREADRVIAVLKRGSAT